MNAVVYPLFAFSLFLFWSTPTKAQPGCPDPQASNYNSSATSNDGSCLYPVTAHVPALISELPSELREISGLTKAASKWWGNNDGGFNEEFFCIEPGTGDILQTIKLNNAHNRDWEEITSDSLNLYVGDFGNNANDRQNLGIYIVPLSEIGDSNSETVQEFEYIK